MSDGLSRTGYSFAGWNTEANGTGTEYAAGATITLSSDETLYAQWTPDAYVVTLNGEGATVSSPVNYTYGSPALTLPSLTMTGYTFTGWFSAATGGTLVGNGGSTFTPTSDTSLFAQWAADVYTVTLNGEGATVTSPLSYTYGGAGLTLPTPTMTGYTFNGWFSAASGGSSVSAGGAGYVPSSSITLYAQWTALTYTVSYDANGGSLSPSTATFTVGSTGVTLPTPTYGGYVFAGWFDAPTGGHLVGGAGGNYLPSATVTLYAQWTAVPLVTITFDPNGGSGSVASIVGPTGSTVTLPDGSGLIYPGYSLSSWNAALNGSAASYHVAGTMQLSSSATLYAQWVRVATRLLYGTVGQFPGRSTTLTANVRQQIQKLALAIQAKHYKNVTLYGFVVKSSSHAKDLSVSLSRARAVANYLRSRLSALHVAGVTITATGQGAIRSQSTTANSRVEVFVL